MHLNSIVCRIEKLEKRVFPVPETETPRYRKLVADLEAGRQRAIKCYADMGLTRYEPSDEGLPPKKVHTSQGVQYYLDITREGFERVKLRRLRDEKLRQPVPAPGDAGIPDSALPTPDPPMGNSPTGD
jgi:hypothetical protein